MTYDLNDVLIAYAGQLKTFADDGHVSGLLVVYSTPDSPDLTGDVFTAATDFGKARESYIWLNHALPIKADRTVIHIDEPIGEGQLTLTDEGVVIEGLLYAKYRYLSQIAPELGWSSGTAAHLVRREPVAGTSVHHIVRWPLGLDASLTPTPAEPRTMRQVVPLKTLCHLTAPPMVQQQVAAPSVVQRIVIR